MAEGRGGSRMNTIWGRQTESSRQWQPSMGVVHPRVLEEGGQVTRRLGRRVSGRRRLVIVGWIFMGGLDISLHVGRRSHG